MASFASLGPDVMAPWPPPIKAAPRSIRIVIDQQLRVDGKEDLLDRWSIERWKDATIEAYRESGAFSKIVTGPESADLRAEVSILDELDRSQFSAALSGLTLWLAPVWVVHAYTVTTTFKDSGGRTLGQIRRTGSITTCTEILMIVVMPFAWPAHVESRTLLHLSQSTLVEAWHEGIL